MKQPYVDAALLLVSAYTSKQRTAADEQVAHRVVRMQQVLARTDAEVGWKYVQDDHGSTFTYMVCARAVCGFCSSSFRLLTEDLAGIWPGTACKTDDGGVMWAGTGRRGDMG